MSEIANAVKDLDMWERTLPAGWVILGYGIDGVTENKYVRIKLPNNIVASIISGKHTYGGPEGLWEIAPCWYGGSDHFEVMTCTEMRAVIGWIDVHGWLDNAEVMATLEELAEVPEVRVTVLQPAMAQLRAQGIY